jgi:hypothetical protein
MDIGKIKMVDYKITKKGGDELKMVLKTEYYKGWKIRFTKENGMVRVYTNEFGESFYKTKKEGFEATKGVLDIIDKQNKQNI